jgi:DNA polymerase III subunit delta'
MSRPAGAKDGPKDETPRQPLPEVDGRVLERLRTLAARAPQSLVMEGGGAPDREAAAFAWARAVNCPERGCGECPACRQIDGRVFRDLLIIDRAFFEEAKKEGKSGTDKVRELLPVWGQPPHGAGSRVTIFPEAQDLHPSVANLLLKTLEEPRPGNVFALLAPQRERLLQTLVSRSFVLTLPWPEARSPEAEAAEWIGALLNFWDTGRGWFERTGQKGAADRALGQRILSGLQRELILALSGRAEAGEAGAAARRLARLGPAGLRRLDLVLAEAQEALTQPTAPVALVLDWLATAVITGLPPRTHGRG